jgi:hypothetical protein
MMGYPIMGYPIMGYPMGGDPTGSPRSLIISYVLESLSPLWPRKTTKRLQMMESSENIYNSLQFVPMLFIIALLNHRLLHGLRNQS